MVNLFASSSLRRLLSGWFILLAATAAGHAGTFRTVVIDPGHGGHDIGGHYGKVYEKHLALDTAMRLENYLKAAGYRTVMTRRSDTFISLPMRASIGNRHSNSIFVSIHYNYTWKRDVSGLETFYYNSRSRPLANYVHAGMMRRANTVNRGVKQARYYVIRRAKNPAILVECGFVSNYRERARMKKGSFRDGMARGIAEGIARYQDARRRGHAR
ncbi:MAG: N-acetylmuramoyl-L-alanine amidase [Akkermansiaceae bacterium]|nr:N-acetylmuramoyl-L-alanine amidase [Akkermansiaceae bacterium]NNM30845.1 N-acetylmuramoyl-L-alanine amidase [Akkermansiaceae bacterium]